MPESLNNLLACKKCNKEYPPGTDVCPEDGSELDPTGPDQTIGTIFADKYEILSKLGEGGMSRVYKARHTLMNRFVAVKLLHEEATHDPIAKARFQLEAQAASALSHPNVVTVHDFGMTSTGAYFIMDCLEGKSLSDILEDEGCIEVEQAINIFTQTCEGLDHAHRKGIIHRDIKPSNIVLVKHEDGSDLVKLVDFGIAKLIKTDEKTKKSLTQTGEVFGTPYYMSPEQCTGAQLDQRSDIYALGCLMYEALSGEPPLMAESFISTIAKQITDVPEHLTAAVPHKNIPEQLNTIVMKCLEKKPQDRYSSAMELKQALLDCAYAIGIKGLRVGAVPEPIQSGSGDKVVSTSIQTKKTQHQLLQYKQPIIAGVVTLVLAGVGWYIFVDSGSAGDGSTIWQQVVWETGILQSEGLVKEKKYSQAQDTLLNSLQVAEQFDNDEYRIVTLNKLVEVTDLNHDFSTQKACNEQLAKIGDAKVDKEFELIMSMLTDWERPSNEIEDLERKQRAVSFGERIAKLSDTLTKHSLDKLDSELRRQALLTKAIKVFDSMDLKSTIHGLRFRYALADSYRSQQRFSKIVPLLKETLDLFPNPTKSAEMEKLKVRTALLLGQSEGVTAKTIPQLDQSTKMLESALNWAKALTPPDPLLIRDCYNTLVMIYRKYDTPEQDAIAAKLAHEAGIPLPVDDDEDDNK